MNIDDKIISELNRRIADSCYGTAYPWRPEEWQRYAMPGNLPFNDCHRLSFYVHVPFCKHLCKFCEYTRCRVPDEQLQRRYLETLAKDIDEFLQSHPEIMLEGFDIGGGTPTALSPDNFRFLIELYTSVTDRVALSFDYEPSIETSFLTIDKKKAALIAEAGIRRISMGIQSLYFSKATDAVGWKHPQALEIATRIKMLREVAPFKINLDFMYGFKGQTNWDEFEANRRVLEFLNPDQVTLYELRTNQQNRVSADVDEEKALLYDRWFDLLSGMGYIGRYGQNTFSRNADDFGVSSYIRHRMLDGGDYKGFGLSAQSMTGGNVEYNEGKNASDLPSLIQSLESFEATSHYDLPNEEKLAKFICISSYNGGFNWKIAQDKFNPDFMRDNIVMLATLKENGLITVDGTLIRLTKEGFKHYGAVLSMFYK